MEYTLKDNTVLCHHGVPGMKWGHHKFHNDDGSLNSKGRRRYDYAIDQTKKAAKESDKYAKNAGKNVGKVIGGAVGLGAAGFMLSKSGFSGKNPTASVKIESGKKKTEMRGVKEFTKAGSLAVSLMLAGSTIGGKIGSMAAKDINRSAYDTRVSNLIRAKGTVPVPQVNVSPITTDDNFQKSKKNITAYKRK